MREIWMIYQDAVPPNLPGGTRHYDFGRELVKAGYKVKIFAANVNLSLRRRIRQMDNCISREEDINGVIFEWISTCAYKKNNWRRVLNMVLFSWHTFQNGRNQAVKPDVIIGSSPNLFAAFAACLLAKKIKCQFILEIRDLWPRVLVDMGVSKLHPIVLLFSAMEKYLYNNAKHIIVLAQGSTDYLINYGIPKSKITFIPNGVHLEHFASNMERKKAKQIYGFQRFTIIYTGVHGPSHGLSTVLEAAKVLRGNDQIQFVLVGDGSKKKELINKAKEYKLDNIVFMDPVPKAQIPNLLLAADVGLISLRDAQIFRHAISPNKLYDYMAAGKPVLCSVAGHIADFVQKIGCGIISTPEDGIQLAEKAVVLAQMSEKDRCLMGTLGRQEIERNYSRSGLVNRLKTVIDLI